ncbi:hypothetical protein ACWDX6_27755 [Streptomyces sp. NPDC003027]
MAKLRRFTEIIEDPGYADPARQNLPARNLVVLLVTSVAVIVGLLVWRYPGDHRDDSIDRR